MRPRRCSGVGELAAGKRGRRGAAGDEHLQCLPVLRRCVRGVSGHVPGSGVLRSSIALPGKPLPQLHGLLSQLPVRSAAPLCRQCAGGFDGTEGRNLRSVCVARHPWPPVSPKRSVRYACDCACAVDGPGACIRPCRSGRNVCRALGARFLLRGDQPRRHGGRCGQHIRFQSACTLDGCAQFLA